MDAQTRQAPRWQPMPAACGIVVQSRPHAPHEERSVCRSVHSCWPLAVAHSVSPSSLCGQRVSEEIEDAPLAAPGKHAVTASARHGGLTHRRAGRETGRRALPMPQVTNARIARTCVVTTASCCGLPMTVVPEATVVEPQARLTGHAALLEKVLLELETVWKPEMTVLVWPLDE